MSIIKIQELEFLLLGYFDGSQGKPLYLSCQHVVIPGKIKNEWEDTRINEKEDEQKTKNMQNIYYYLENTGVRTRSLQVAKLISSQPQTVTTGVALLQFAELTYST